MRAVSAQIGSGCILTLVVLAACSGQDNSAPVSQAPASTASVLPSTTMKPPRPAPSNSPTDANQFKQPYVNALEEFLAAYSRADTAGDPDNPDLQRYATGPALAWVTKQVSDHRRLGVAHNGQARLRDIGVVGVTARSARVGQCMDWSGWPVVNRTTGALFQQFPAWSQLVRADVVASGGKWKVQRITVTAVLC